MTPFFDLGAPAWVAEAVSPASLAKAGIWDAGRVGGLIRRCREGRAKGVREGMAAVGILSSQLWYESFIEARSPNPAETSVPRVRIDRRAHNAMREAS